MTKVERIRRRAFAYVCFKVFSSWTKIRIFSKISNVSKKSFKCFEGWYVSENVFFQFRDIVYDFIFFGAWGKNSPQYVTYTEMELTDRDMCTCRGLGGRRYVTAIDHSFWDMKVALLVSNLGPKIMKFKQKNTWIHQGVRRNTYSHWWVLMKWRIQAFKLPPHARPRLLLAMECSVLVVVVSSKFGHGCPPLKLQALRFQAHKFVSLSP